MAITNAVLQERLEQQHAQAMLLLAKVDDKLTRLNGSVNQIQLTSTEHAVRINKIEKCTHTIQAREDKLRAEIEEVRSHTWRIAVAVAIIAGAAMSASERILGVLLP